MIVTILIHLGPPPPDPPPRGKRGYADTLINSPLWGPGDGMGCPATWIHVCSQVCLQLCSSHKRAAGFANVTKASMLLQELSACAISRTPKGAMNSEKDRIAMTQGFLPCSA